jgi:hypothetical protein
MLPYIDALIICQFDLCEQDFENKLIKYLIRWSLESILIDLGDMHMIVEFQTLVR